MTNNILTYLREEMEDMMEYGFGDRLNLQCDNDEVFILWNLRYNFQIVQWIKGNPVEVARVRYPEQVINWIVTQGYCEVKRS